MSEASIVLVNITRETLSIALSILIGRTFYINVYVSNDQDFLPSEERGRGTSVMKTSGTSTRKQKCKRCIHQAVILSSDVHSTPAMCWGKECKVNKITVLLLLLIV